MLRQKYVRFERDPLEAGIPLRNVGHAYIILYSLTQHYLDTSHSYLLPVCSQASPASQQPCSSLVEPTILKIVAGEPTELCLTVITVAVGAAFLCLLVLTVIFPLAICICVKHRVSGRSPKHRVKTYCSKNVGFQGSYDL